MEPLLREMRPSEVGTVIHLYGMRRSATDDRVEQALDMMARARDYQCVRCLCCRRCCWCRATTLTLLAARPERADWTTRTCSPCSTRPMQHAAPCVCTKAAWAVPSCRSRPGGGVSALASTSAAAQHPPLQHHAASRHRLPWHHRPRRRVEAVKRGEPAAQAVPSQASPATGACHRRRGTRGTTTAAAVAVLVLVLVQLLAHGPAMVAGSSRNHGTEGAMRLHRQSPSLQRGPVVAAHQVVDGASARLRRLSAVAPVVVGVVVRRLRPRLASPSRR